MKKRPPLRYHGGKWLLAVWIIAHLPPHKIYVEPYGGAASVLLRKGRVYSEVYNDINGEVVNLFRVLQDPLLFAKLRHKLHYTPYARAEFVQAYVPCKDPVESARRLIVRSFLGFGSAAASNSAFVTGFRAIAYESGTTPARDWMHLPDALITVSERLRGVVIEEKPALTVLRAHDGPDTLFYVDPPYPHETRHFRRRATHNGYAHELSDTDHAELLQTLLTLRGKVVLSSYPNEMYADVLRPAGWVAIEKDARADGGRKRVEMLWKNPAAQDGAQGQFCFA